MDDARFIVADQLQMDFKANGSSVKVFDGIDLAIRKGEFLAIIGPSGCGKTTLLRIIGALLEPTQGTLSIGGLLPSEALAQRFFSFVFQNPVLLPWHNVRENIRLAGEVLRDEHVSDQADELIELVGLEGFEKAYPGQLSGGMKARVALARALTFHPQVLLLDEPFGALDEMTRLEMNHLLMDVLKRVPATTILVTHSIDEAVYMADRVVLLSPRPARIQDEYEIPFARPRTFATRDQHEFLVIRSAIQRVLMGRDELNGATRMTPEDHERLTARRESGAVA